MLKYLVCFVDLIVFQQNATDKSAFQRELHQSSQDSRNADCIPRQNNRKENRVQGFGCQVYSVQFLRIIFFFGHGRHAAFVHIPNTGSRSLFRFQLALLRLVLLQYDQTQHQGKETLHQNENMEEEDARQRVESSGHVVVEEGGEDGHGDGERDEVGRLVPQVRRQEEDQGVEVGGQNQGSDENHNVEGRLAAQV